MIERLPPPETYGVACERVRCLQALFNASVTSAGRTAKRNAKVGGADLSKHQIIFGCCAWDLVPDRPIRRSELANAARILGFWVELEKDCVHLQSISPGTGSMF